MDYFSKPGAYITHDATQPLGDINAGMYVTTSAHLIVFIVAPVANPQDTKVTAAAASTLLQRGLNQKYSAFTPKLDEEYLQQENILFLESQLKFFTIVRKKWT